MARCPVPVLNSVLKNLFRQVMCSLGGQGSIPTISSLSCPSCLWRKAFFVLDLGRAQTHGHCLLYTRTPWCEAVGAELSQGFPT